MTGRVELDDRSGGAARTTATLIASLGVRIRTLALISGSDAIGSMVAGFAALGRQAAATAEGARLRRSLLQGRAGANGSAIWEALGVSANLSALPPSPVYDDLRNDLALLAAPDVERALRELAGTDLSAAIGPVADPGPVDFIDFLVGIWAYARDLVAAVETLGGDGGPEVAAVRRPDDIDGSVLR